MEVIAKRCTVATLSGVLSYENVYRVYTEDECILCTLLMIKDNTFLSNHNCTSVVKIYWLIASEYFHVFKLHS